MDFIGKVVPKKEGTRDVSIRAHYNKVKQRWFAVLAGEEHPISKASLEISGAKILYSLPQNEEHEPWTKREVSNIVDPFEVGRWWSVLCEGVAILGKPNKKEGTWDIIRILHDNIKVKD